MNEVRYWLRKAQSFLWHSPEPVTRTFIAAKILFFFVYLLFFLEAGFNQYLGFHTQGALLQPWTFLSYPILSNSPFELIFGSYWMWLVGSTLERSLTSRVFAKYLLALILIPSISIWIGSQILTTIGAGFLGSTHAWLISMYIPLAGLTVSWCLINPDRIIMFGFVLPIPGRVIMFITIVLTYFAFAWTQHAPWLAFFGMIHIMYSSYYMHKISQLSGQGSDYLYREGPPNIFERFNDWLSFFWRKILRSFSRK